MIFMFLSLWRLAYNKGNLTKYNSQQMAFQKFLIHMWRDVSTIEI